MKRMLIAVTLACVISGTALAGETPGVPGSMLGSTSTGETSTPPIPGDMPGIGSATASENNGGLATTLLLTIIATLIGR